MMLRKQLTYIHHKTVNRSTNESMYGVIRGCAVKHTFVKHKPGIMSFRIEACLGPTLAEFMHGPKSYIRAVI